MLDSVETEDGALVLSFSHTGSGLEARGGALKEFAVAGADGRYVWADAEIRGDQVVVRSDAVPDPMWVRYAWADNPAGANLYNREGLPASPFQARFADP
jgi:sialate O-acetylesterase